MVEWDVFWRFVAQFSILFFLFIVVYVTFQETRKQYGRNKKDQ